MENKKSTRKERLLNYTMTAGALAVAGAANAQVIYTDVNPDEVVTTGNSYNLDLNTSVTDFVISAQARSGSVSGFAYSGVGIVLSTGASNGVMAHAGTTFPGNYASALNLNDMIDNTQNFTSGTSSSSLGGILIAAVGTINGLVPFEVGDWLGKSDLYLGLSFMIGTDMHYGWARMSVNSAATELILKDYAYNSTPNDPIAAGSTVVGINELNIRDHVAMNIANEMLNVSVNSNELSNGEIVITDLTGKQVYAQKMNGSTASVDISALASGMYVISVNFDQGRASEKLFIR